MDPSGRIDAHAAAVLLDIFANGKADARARVPRPLCKALEHADCVQSKDGLDSCRCSGRRGQYSPRARTEGTAGASSRGTYRVNDQVLEELRHLRVRHHGRQLALVTGAGSSMARQVVRAARESS